MVKDMMLICCFLHQFIVDFNTQVNTNLPTISNDEVAKDESLIADSLEVVHTHLPASDLLQDTGDSRITISNKGPNSVS